MRKCAAFGMACVGSLSIIAACTQGGTPASPAAVPAAQALHNEHAADASHGVSAGDKGFIDGWFNGQTVQLYYTKSFSCAEPPESGASTVAKLVRPARGLRDRGESPRFTRSRLSAVLRLTL